MSISPQLWVLITSQKSIFLICRVFLKNIDSFWVFQIYFFSDRLIFHQLMRSDNMSGRRLVDCSSFFMFAVLEKTTYWLMGVGPVIRGVGKEPKNRFFKIFSENSIFPILFPKLSEGISRCFPSSFALFPHASVR